MINCSDTTNIFALGFGLSAVIAVVGESAASARRRFLAAVAAEIKLTSPELHEKNLSNERFERYVFASFPGIRKIIYLNLPIRLFAAFVLVASLGTLVQVAVLGTSCTMSEQNLYTYIVLAFVFSPLVYWAYKRIVDYTIDAALRKGLPKKGALLLSLILSDLQSQDDLMESIHATIKKQTQAGRIRTQEESRPDGA